MKISCGVLTVTLCLAIVSICCKPSADYFDEDIARGAIEGRPMNLEGEQVTLNEPLIQCGVQAELWDPPAAPSPDHSTAHLSAKGRELKFNDDVIVRDPGARQPYVQVRGNFQLQIESISAIKDGEDKFARLVEAKVGVKVDNPCFPRPLPLMGVKHGNFSADTPVVFHVRLDESGGWHADKIVH